MQTGKNVNSGRHVGSLSQNKCIFFKDSILHRVKILPCNRPPTDRGNTDVITRIFYRIECRICMRGHRFPSQAHMAEYSDILHNRTEDHFSKVEFHFLAREDHSVQFLSIPVISLGLNEST